MSGSAPGERPWPSRDFDYGVGDDLTHAVSQVRLQIAREIRLAAHLDRTPRAVQEALEQAARIAETGSSSPAERRR